MIKYVITMTVIVLTIAKSSELFLNISCRLDAAKLGARQRQNIWKYFLARICTWETNAKNKNNSKPQNVDPDEARTKYLRIFSRKP